MANRPTCRCGRGRMNPGRVCCWRCTKRPRRDRVPGYRNAEASSPALAAALAADADRQARIARYAERAALGLPLFG